MDIGPTQMQLGTEVLERINIIAPGEAAEPADLQKAIDALNHVHEHLRSVGKLRWAWADMPEHAKLPYKIMAAALCGPDFGREVSMDFDAGMKLLLRGVSVAQPDDYTTVGDYF